MIFCRGRQSCVVDCEQSMYCCTNDNMIVTEMLLAIYICLQGKQVKQQNLVEIQSPPNPVTSLLYSCTQAGEICARSPGIACPQLWLCVITGSETHLSLTHCVKCVSHMENCLGVDKERLNINLQRAEECMYVSWQFCLKLWCVRSLLTLSSDQMKSTSMKCSWILSKKLSFF